MEQILSDKRKINYLRISITDRCNLRCMYCMSEEGINFLAHDQVLSYEEILHLVRISVKGGIRKVRLTGGEPLVRKGFIPFLEKLSGVHELDEITLTTNGILLEEYAEEIRNCGICRLNISLDSLKAERFHRITRRDCFDRAVAGIKAAERVGFDPIKINVVAMRGINDDELVDFAQLTMEKPYHVRFIEFMPIGETNGWEQRKFIPTEEIHQRIKILGRLNPLPNHRLDGPASRYKIEGAIGEIGFIGALSNHFCDRCNRLRLTADGQLRGCLFSDSEIDVKTPMREGCPDSHLLELIQQAIRSKPLDHGALAAKPKKCVRPMSAIGG